MKDKKQRTKEEKNWEILGGMIAIIIFLQIVLLIKIW